MNEYEINASEFSGASASTRILKAATALATAVLTGYKTVIRNVSTTVEYRTSITAYLLNQYNGVIVFASTVSQSVVISAQYLRSMAVSSAVSAEYQVTSFITAVRRTAATVVQSAAEITANLKDQFNGLLLAGAQVAQNTLINARATKIAISKAIISSTTQILARLRKTSQLSTSINYFTEIQVSTILERSLRAIVDAFYDVYAALTILAPIKAYVLHVTNVVSNAFTTLKGKSAVSSTSSVIANLESSTNAPAGEDNTFVVPPDDTTYDVENS